MGDGRKEGNGREKVTGSWGGTWNTFDYLQCLLSQSLMSTSPSNVSRYICISQNQRNFIFLALRGTLSPLLWLITVSLSSFWHLLLQFSHIQWGHVTQFWPTKCDEGAAAKVCHQSPLSNHEPCWYQNPQMHNPLHKTAYQDVSGEQCSNNNCWRENEDLWKWLKATAGYAYLSLHSHGFGIVLGTWQIQVFLFGTSRDFKKYFQSAIGWIYLVQNPWI